MTRLAPTSLLSVIALVVAVLVVVDLGAPSSATDTPPPVSAGPAVGGAWYCAAGGVADGQELTVVTTVPPTLDAPADTEIRVLDGQGHAPLSQAVFPGSARATQVADAASEAVGTTVRWWDQPTAVSRVWRRTGGEGPKGLVSGPCASAPSPTWYIPGISTAGGATARLYLANAFANDASVSISFLTPTGPVAPILLQNVSVSSSSVTVLDLTEFIPRQGDVGVAVVTRSGRVVVEAVQELDAAIGGVDALALVSAAAQLSETWTIPWSLTDPSAPGEDQSVPVDDAPTPAETPTEEAPTEAPTEEPAPNQLVPGGEIVETASPGNGTASWLWISNPGTQATAVTVTLHTASGPVVPDIGEELLVEPGSVLRVDLRGLLPAGASAAGATLRSENGVPFVAGAGTLLSPEAGNTDVAGYTTQLGWPSADPSWVVPGERSSGRDQVLHVVNPGAEDAVVDVAVWNGASLVRPDGLQDVTVAAGALVEMDLSDLLREAEQIVAFVEASTGSVVVGRHSVGGQVADWVAHSGLPSSLWSGGAVVLPVDHDPLLVENIGTSGGVPSIGADDVDGADDRQPAPSLPDVIVTDIPSETPTDG